MVGHFQKYGLDIEIEKNLTRFSIHPLPWVEPEGYIRLPLRHTHAPSLSPGGRGPITPLQSFVEVVVAIEQLPMGLRGVDELGIRPRVPVLVEKYVEGLLVYPCLWELNLEIGKELLKRLIGDHLSTAHQYSISLNYLCN